MQKIQNISIFLCFILISTILKSAFIFDVDAQGNLANRGHVNNQNLAKLSVDSSS